MKNKGIVQAVLHLVCRTGKYCLMYVYLSFSVRQNNWPPLPKFCPVQPCFYQDINVDIPVEFQKIVKYLYYLWIGHVSLLLSNFVLGFLFLLVGGDGAIGIMFLSLIYFVIFTPSSFVCWFRPAYKAFRLVF